MKVSEKGPVDVYVIVGDGVREHRLIETITPKFDHRKTLGIPGVALGRRETGLTGMIRMLAKLIDKGVTVRTYLALIDKEHVRGRDDVGRKLREHGFDILDVRELTSDCWILRVRRGAREVAVYVTLLGTRKSIEENLAKLIELEFGEQVEASKESIRGWLRKQGISDRELVERASKDKLAQAFPQLARALEELAKDD